MDLSETIVAAMIGAGATVATATFQLFMAFRSRKADSRPKRSNGIRSALAVFGLLLGAAVAGFAYSELRMEREREDTRAMEQRISDRLQALPDGPVARAPPRKRGHAAPAPAAGPRDRPVRAAPQRQRRQRRHAPGRSGRIASSRALGSHGPHRGVP